MHADIDPVQRLKSESGRQRRPHQQGAPAAAAAPTSPPPRLPASRCLTRHSGLCRQSHTRQHKRRVAGPVEPRTFDCSGHPTCVVIQPRSVHIQHIIKFPVRHTEKGNCAIGEQPSQENYPRVHSLKRGSSLQD
eukprot:6189039-Pleurochrysis_carterae.AAC.3